VLSFSFDQGRACGARDGGNDCGLRRNAGYYAQ